jgi:hypothetical protein
MGIILIHCGNHFQPVTKRHWVLNTAQLLPAPMSDMVTTFYCFPQKNDILRIFEACNIIVYGKILIDPIGVHTVLTEKISSSVTPNPWNYFCFAKHLFDPN